ncbi:MAG: transketolase, partial [Deltaproteobacteria bacterium]|nr:transketolase [Deltaproteobacteria bacterium]
GDGDMMEGVSAEAASLAGHLGLGKLICIYDDNKISIEGSTDIAFTEDVAMRFTAYGWHILIVEDGNDIDAISEAIESAQSESEKPSLILLRTQIAYGSPNKQGSADAHGAPLGDEEVCLTKKNLGCPDGECFLISDPVLSEFRKSISIGADAEASWNADWDNYMKSHPDLAENLRAALDNRLSKGWDTELPDFPDTPIATRAASGKVLNALSAGIPTLMGGSADLAPSNKTIINDSTDFQKTNYLGRNIRFGVREHAMGAILSGLALHGGIRPYGGTFLVFADYMRPSIRLAALMKLPIIYVFTHDSVAVGEDGPTHQPVEHIASLRTIPGLTVIRPADANETIHAWRQAIQQTDGPVALILSRQKLPVFQNEQAAASRNLANGAYIISDTDNKPDLTLIGTGSEVHLALDAKKLLADKNVSVRVISMPSWELFEKSTPEYKAGILLEDGSVRLAVEAGIEMGWEKYTVCGGATVSINRFGASAPGATVLKNLGFNAENVAQKALDLLRARA